MNPMFTIFVLVSVLSLGACDWQWRALPGYAKQISAKGRQVFAVNPAGQAMQLVNKTWQVIDQDVQMIAGAADGSAWVIRNNPVPANNIFRADKDRKSWDANPCSFSAFNRVVHVNALAYDNAVGIGPYGGTHWFRGAAWQKDLFEIKESEGVAIGGYAIAIGEGKEIWAINHNNEIFRFNGAAWKKKDGQAISIDVQNKDLIVMTDRYNSVYMWGGNDQWNQIAGQECVQASVNLDGVYCVSPSGAVYAYMEDETYKKKWSS